LVEEETGEGPVPPYGPHEEKGGCGPKMKRRKERRNMGGGDARSA